MDGIKSLGGRGRTRQTSLSTDASFSSLDCSFGFIRAGAFDEQEANVVILEDDSLKQ